MSIFVTDGDQRSTLAVVRALGAAGVFVTVGHSGPSSMAGSSRYCARAVVYPSPLEDGEGFQSFVREELRCGQYRVVLPMTDVTLRLLAAIRGELSPLAVLPFSGEKEVELVQDKRRTLLLARALGIGCPLSLMLKDDDRLEDAAHQIYYPVVIKPRFSRFLCDGRWVAGGVEYAHDAEELLRKYREAHAQIPHPLVQEKIEGEGRGVFLLIWNGELKAAFCHRRLREKPPWGGVSVFSESAPLDETLVEKSYALLREIGWQGVAMVELKVDRRDGQPKLMEVNGRFWGSLQLAIDAGLNFPLLLYRLASGESVPAQFAYRVGVKSRWLLGDLDQLWIQLRHSRRPNGVPTDLRSRLRACADFMKFYEPNMHYEVLRFEDPAPGWFECKAFLRDALRWRRSRRGENHAN